jgi:hypothetical protein
VFVWAAQIRAALPGGQHPPATAARHHSGEAWCNTSRLATHPRTEDAVWAGLAAVLHDGLLLLRRRGRVGHCCCFCCGCGCCCCCCCCGCCCGCSSIAVPRLGYARVGLRAAWRCGARGARTPPPAVLGQKLVPAKRTRPWKEGRGPSGRWGR